MPVELAERAQPLNGSDINGFRAATPRVQTIVERNSLPPEQFLHAFIDLIDVKKDFFAASIANYESESTI
jgi:hypothetical protein